MTQLTGLAHQQQANNGEDLVHMPPGAIQVLPGVTAMQTRGAFTTAVQVAQERELKQVLRRLEAEADLAGEEFYYGWGAAANRVEGPSVKLAMAAVRCWGNCAIETMPVQETHGAWIFTAAFVDFETGFTLTRQFRQSKDWEVFGKFNEQRKADIRFQIGQSKAVRNVIINALPASLITRALARAKDGVRAQIESSIAKHGAVTVIGKMLDAFKKLGITEEQILAKAGVAELKGLTAENLVTLKGDLWAIESGQDWSDEIFPDPNETKDDDNSTPSEPKSQRLLKDLKKKNDKPTPPDADELAAADAG